MRSFLEVQNELNTCTSDYAVKADEEYRRKEERGDDLKCQAEFTKELKKQEKK